MNIEKQSKHFLINHITLLQPKENLKRKKKGGQQSADCIGRMSLKMLFIAYETFTP